ncbi:MAG TPA: NAD(P)-dependent oxidoreductase [Sporolactobacillaceae bacterium]|nr:NAD(P)-dependent oxidoreductase [Sporolactobacillaceae bacterium]
MRILVTGSSGWLGQTLVPRLRRDGHHVMGLDIRRGAHTSIVGSVADRATIERAISAETIDAIVHCAALHKPDIIRSPASDFVSINVQGTLNLLEVAVAAQVKRFVFTSTTSLMVSAQIRAGLDGGATRAAWITEDLAALEPRNIYGVTKLAAEHLCRITAQNQRLPIVILRTSRFFPEEDDMAHAIPQSDENTKANEFLFRRLTVEDAAEAHVAALERAPVLGFARFIISATTPFRPEDCAELIVDAPAVVARYFPEYRAIYEPRGWSMFQSIDRVYSSKRAEEQLGFRCRTTFAEILRALH